MALANGAKAVQRAQSLVTTDAGNQRRPLKRFQQLKLTRASIRGVQALQPANIMPSQPQVRTVQAARKRLRSIKWLRQAPLKIKERQQCNQCRLGQGQGKSITQIPRCNDSWSRKCDRKWSYNPAVSGMIYGRGSDDQTCRASKDAAVAQCHRASQYFEWPGIQYLMVHQVSWMCRLMVQALVSCLSTHSATVLRYDHRLWSKSLMDQVHSETLLPQGHQWNLVIRFLWLRSNVLMVLILMRRRLAPVAQGDSISIVDKRLHLPMMIVITQLPCVVRS